VPASTLDRARVLSLVPVPLSTTQLDDLLFASKVELTGQDDRTLAVSVTPDRLDLLSEGGLGLYLEGAVEGALGAPAVRPAPPEEPSVRIEVDPSVAPLRPQIAGVVVRAPEGAALDDDLRAEAIRFQELLHDSLGRERRAASLGIYPIASLTAPIRYSLEPLGGVRFVPLGGLETVDGPAFYRDHPMALRYGPLGRSGDRCLVLRDARDEVLSLPPVLNSRGAGEARVGDRALLLESTGTKERAVREALGLLLLVFAARGWSAAPVAVRGADGREDDGRSLLAPRAIDLPSAIVAGVTGESLASAEVARRLGRARVTARPHGAGWRVDVPPWRPDLQTAVDLAEEVVIAAPIRPESGLVPPSPVRGRRRSETNFRRRFAAALLGLGLALPNTSLLLSDAAVARLPTARPIRLRYPVSAEFSYVRDRLLLSHLEVLARNTRHGYPQRFGEVGPVLVVDPASESGARTAYRLGIVVAADGAGFADAAGIVDHLLRGIDVVAVREPAELPGGIAGRAARARVAGEPVAELGEIDPGILTELGVPVPAVWAELDLSALWLLSGLREAA